MNRAKCYLRIVETNCVIPQHRVFFFVSFYSFIQCNKLQSLFV